VLIRFKFLRYFALILTFVGSLAWAEDLPVYYPKSRAPMEVRKGAVAPIGALSASDIAEFKGEFGGILYMAKQPFSYSRWPGKEMSDCKEVAIGGQCAECELTMGHSSAIYYFYRGSNGSCTLQQVDAHFQSSDTALIKALRATGQSVFGRAIPGTKVHSVEPGWDGSGSGYMWKDSEDWAYLYMDTYDAGENTEGLARFQWRRTPLYHSSH
jgi:hypothetical protein